MKNRPLILAHRGFSHRFPENTGLAFAEAIKAGADGIECDIQRTKDGVFVVLHDETIDRTSNGKGRADKHTFQDLLQFDFGRGEKLLDVSALLALIPQDRFINLEIKAGTLRPQDLPLFFAQVKGARGTKNIIISSFEHSWLALARDEGFQTGMLFGDEHQAMGLKGWIDSIRKIKPTYLHLPVEMFSRLGKFKARMVLAVFRVLGARFNFWTVNTPSDWAYIAKKSEFVITDVPDLAQSWMV